MSTANGYLVGGSFRAWWGGSEGLNLWIGGEGGMKDWLCGGGGMRMRRMASLFVLALFSGFDCGERDV